MAQSENKQQGTQADGTVVPPSVAIPQDATPQAEDDDKGNGPITVTPQGEKNKQQY